MNQALNLIQDLEFTEATESAATVVGGLTIAHRPVHDGGWDDWFPKPLPRPMPHPVPFPSCEQFASNARLKTGLVISCPGPTYILN